MFTLFRKYQDRNLIIFTLVLSQLRLYLSLMDFDKRYEYQTDLQLTSEYMILCITILLGQYFINMMIN